MKCNLAFLNCEKDARRVSCERKKLCMCFVDLINAFDRVPWKVLEWALRKKGIPEVLVISVMSLCEGENISVRVDSKLSEEFVVKVEMLQGSVLSPFPFAVVIDVVTEFP